MRLSKGDIVVNKAVALGTNSTQELPDNNLLAKLEISEVEKRKEKFFKKAETKKEKERIRSDIKSIIALDKSAVKEGGDEYKYTFDTIYEDEQLAQVFDERGMPTNIYGPFFEGLFQPYIPSEKIIGKFYQIDEKNNTDAMEQALPIINKMIEAFQNAPLNKPFKYKLSDFNLDNEEDEQQPKSNAYDPFSQSALPVPDVNPALMSQVLPSNNTMETGLTRTEQALLSNEEKAIRLKQRGMTS